MSKYGIYFSSQLLPIRVGQTVRKYKLIVVKASEIEIKECAQEGTICIYTIVYYTIARDCHTSWPKPFR